MNELHWAAAKFQACDYMPVGVVVLQSDLVVLYWNALLAEWTGVSSAEIVGKNIGDFYPHLRQARYAVRLEYIFAGGPPQTFSAHLHHDLIPCVLPDGGPRIQQCTATAVPTSTGQGFHSLLSFQDVTGITRRNRKYKTLRSQALHEIEVRKETEQQLRESRQRLTIALENASIEIWEWNLVTGEYRMGQHPPLTIPSFEEMIVFARQQNIVSEEIDTALAALQDHMQGRTALYQVEYCIFAENGSGQWFLDTGRVVERNSDGEVLSIIGTHLDITDRKHAEKTRLQFALEQEKVNILANFVRNVSHEFRNPLMVINTRLYRLKKPIDGETYRQQLTSISKQVDYINKLVNDMFLMTLLDAGHDFQLLPVAVNTLLHDLITKQQAAAQAQGIILTLNMGDEALTILGDAPKLHQAIKNLIENALQNTPANGYITLTAAICAGQLVIKVQDSGRGISAKHLPYIFDRFYRTDEARTERRAGLGLTIAKKIITLHGGTIQVESQPEQGTIFQITLPI